MPFGKHRGEELEDIPASYLLWILDNIENLSPTLRVEIERILDIDQDAAGTARPEQQRLTDSTVDRWYRQLAREFHPDVGGSHEAMKAVNRGRELMLELLKS